MCKIYKFSLQTMKCGHWLVVIAHVESGYTDVAGLFAYPWFVGYPVRF